MERWIERHEAPAELQCVAMLRGRARALALQAGFAADAVGAIELAVGEALMNAVEHAHRGSDEVKMWVTCTVDEAGMHIAVRDNGCRQWDPSCALPPELTPEGDEGPHLAERGRGLLFMRMMMDSVDIHVTASGTEVLLFKRRSGTSDGGKRE